jgi:hypothetical protein
VYFIAASELNVVDAEKNESDTDLTHRYPAQGTQDGTRAPMVDETNAYDE